MSGGGTGGARYRCRPDGRDEFRFFMSARGLGDAAPPWLRPFALSGILAFQAADSAARPDRLVVSGVVEYSIPYLESKVVEVPLPDWARRLTPLVEFQVSAPVASSGGAETSALIDTGRELCGRGLGVGR